MRIRARRTRRPDTPAPPAGDGREDAAEERGSSDPDLRSVPDDPALAAERRIREAGGPDDRSLYRCGCGYIFEAHVSTDVGCPHCGTTQAW